MLRWIARSTCVVALAALAGCATPPPPPPPPAPPVIVLPPPMQRPYPPNSAAPNLVIPVTDVNGRRMTPNVDLSPEQALWHLRIGLNVAALNCRGPNDQQLIDNYTQFLNSKRSAIAASERWVIANMRGLHGGNGVSQRDTLSTRLYNYFAQPPVHDPFCEVATMIAALAAIEPADTILPFALARLTELDQPFVNFYTAYSRYQADYATWHAQQQPAIEPAVLPPSAVAPMGPMMGDPLNAQPGSLSPQPIPPTSMPAPTVLPPVSGGLAGASL